MCNELASFPVIYQQSVAWGDMDSFNHVNNVVYYRYAESARIDYLSQLGLFNVDNVLVLAQSSCHYLHPVYFPDTLHIGVRCKKLGNTSMVSDYGFYSEEQKRIVATAEAVIVQLDYEAKNKLAWSDEQRQKIMALEASIGSVKHT